jgi:hypothetical protein
MTHGGGERDGLNEEADERARNEMAFTTERFRRVGFTTAPIFSVTRDLELIANHANVASLNLPADLVVLAYEENDGDIVNALMQLTEPILRRRLEQQLAERARVSTDEEDEEDEEDTESEEEDEEDEEEALAAAPPEDRSFAIARLRHATRADTLRRLELRRIDDANVASIEGAMVEAQEALARSPEMPVVQSADWQPSFHDWARLSATAWEDGYSGGGGHATRTQQERTVRLHELLRSTQTGSGSIHDAGNSGQLRDLVYPTLEWRMAWAHQRHHFSDTPWALEDGEWYRAIAMLAARYPDRCRRDDPYRGQAPDAEDAPERLWFEWLMKEPSAYENRDRLGAEVAEQQRRTEAVQRKLASLGSHPLFGAEASFPALRNHIRALMRDTMVNLRPGARQWPDPIWGHVLSCVRKWDEEMLSMRSAQQRAVQLRGGGGDALIEAHAELISVADREYVAAEALDAVDRHLSARDARENANEPRYEWPHWDQQLNEVAAAEATATAAEVARTRAEEVAMPLAAAAVRATSHVAGTQLVRSYHRLQRTRATPTPWTIQGVTPRALAREQSEGVWSTATATYVQPRPWVDREDITKRREALEDQMEQGELTEYEYLERMNALRDEFNGAPPPPPVGVQQTRRERVAYMVETIETMLPSPPNEDIPDAD